MKNILLLEDLPEIRTWLEGAGDCRSSRTPRSSSARACTTRRRRCRRRSSTWR